jgi:hypothetical protein
MAKVYFFQMRVTLQSVIDLLDKYSGANADKFEWLLFQPETEKPKKNRDEFELAAFVLDTNWKVTEVLSRDSIPKPDSILCRDENKPKHEHVENEDLSFANYPWKRSKIEALINSLNPALIKYLYFIPTKSETYPKYIIFKIVPASAAFVFVETLTGDELNPSPPFEPGQ